MLNTEFSPWPSFTQEEADAASNVLLSNKVNYWTGDQGRQFEKEFAHWAGVSHAIAVSNGTVALDLILVGLNIGKHYGGAENDEVIVTPRSFIASVSTVTNAGATPIFADVDPDSGNITAQTIAEKISPNTKAIIAVHLAGWPCDMEEIIALAKPLGIRVIEDCAQAHGAKYKGKSVGSFGDAAAWSFCQDKIMTTGGEGGMVTTNNPNLWSKMWSFKDHGKSHDAVYNRKHPPGFRWLHESFGTNWRMTEMQSAIGRIQLQRMNDWSRARTQNAQALIDTLKMFSCVRVPRLAPEHVHAFYKLYAYVVPENLKPGWDRDRIVATISAQGVPAMQGSCSEIYREQAFQTIGKPVGTLKTAKYLGETSIMMLVHPTITSEQIKKSQDVLKTVLSEAEHA